MANRTFALQERIEMAIYSNEIVLDALRRVQYRQVPWARRPGVFGYLRALGLLGIVRQKTVAPGAGFHAPVDIAILTDTGRKECARLEHEERLPDWTDCRTDEYVLSEASAVAILESRL